MPPVLNELHYHECPSTGCHKKWQCTGPCGRFYFKACESHEAKPPAAPPSVKTAEKSA